LSISASISRAKRFNQGQKELLEIISKMKEPPPVSRKEASQLAVNIVYRKNQRKASGWRIVLPENVECEVNTTCRLDYFTNMCEKKSIRTEDLLDCAFSNEMRERRNAVQVKIRFQI